LGGDGDNPNVVNFSLLIEVKHFYQDDFLPVSKVQRRKHVKNRACSTMSLFLSDTVFEHSSKNNFASLFIPDCFQTKSGNYLSPIFGIRNLRWQCCFFVESVYGSNLVMLPSFQLPRTILRCYLISMKFSLLSSRRSRKAPIANQQLAMSILW